ncbi:diaminobutyrate acetyltransferase [Pontiellaceae bacterium B12219]|nr:diaminobutyrate acetyltransferase [Pontiellaceae bacterium B12219]
MSIATEIEIEPPQPTDGFRIHRLIRACPPLDENSMYCNLLQCTHFHETSIAAKSNEEVVGFVSGYLKPTEPNTLFIWQVAVAESARGQGLASRMIVALQERPACQTVNCIETTITPSNKASQNLFSRLAETLSAPVRLLEGFDKQKHFNHEHESEQLWQIGPIPKIKTRLLI